METRERSGRGLILAGMMLSLLMYALDSTVVSTAMRSIVEHIGGAEAYSLPFTAYMVCATIATLVCGGVSDAYGHKRIFLVGIAAFALFSLGCAVSTSMEMLICFRALQGIGGGIIAASVFTVASDIYPLKERGKYIGIITSMYGLASVIGPLVGGVFSDTIGWQWIFLVNLPIAVVAFSFIMHALPQDAKGGAQSFDVIGAVLIALSIACLLAALGCGGKYFAWLSLPCFVLVLLGVVALIAFFFHERRIANPLVPLTLFRSKTIRHAFLIGFCAQFVMLVTVMYIPYFVQGVLGESATVAGTMSLPMMIALQIASLLAGALCSKWGKTKGLIVMAFFLIITGLTIFALMTPHVSLVVVICAMVLVGFGLGITMPIANINAQMASSKEQIGMVTALVLFFRNIGGAVGTAACGAFMLSIFKSDFQGYSPAGLHDSFEEPLQSLDVLTSRAAIEQLQSAIPPELLDAFGQAYQSAQALLSHAITTTFLFCVVLAILALVVTLSWKEKSMPNRI